MGKQIAKQVLSALVTLLAVAVLTFFLMYAVPGNPWLSEKTPAPAVQAALNAKYGQDRPLPVRLLKYLGNLLRGDLGVSIRMQKDYPVADLIRAHFPISARVGGLALLWAVPAGIGLGSLAACRRGKPADRVIQGISVLGIATPEFAVAAVLLMTLTAGGALPLFPNSFAPDNPASYVLPCLTLGLYPMCYLARQTRAALLEALSQDYIWAARARGVPARSLAGRHAMKNALIPVLASLGPMTAFLLTGSFVVERMFGIAGLGRYFTQSVLNRDYPVIMGCTLFLAALLVACNLAADLLCRLADPRIHSAEKGGR